MMTMTTLSQSDRDYLRDSIASATTADEIAAIRELLGEPESSEQTESPVQWIVSTQADVAEFFGVHLQAVKDWRQMGMPGEQGSWNIRDIARWRVRKENQASPAAEKKKQASADREVLAFEREKFEFDLKRGQYVERSEVEREVAAALVKTRERLSSVPEALSLQMPLEHRATAYKEAEIKIHSILIALHGDLTKNVCDTEESSRSNSAAAVCGVDGMAAAECPDAPRDGNSG